MVHKQKNNHYSMLKNKPLDYRSESGIGYVMILLLLVLMSSLSLAFLQKVGTETSATMKRGDGMQAYYLAESAANHAMYRLMNESSFPDSETKYYMHSLGQGRYGYKVRKHTATTFATIATVGAIGENVVNKSYVLHIKNKNKLLFVVPDASLLGAQDTVKKTLFESWNFIVTEISAVDSQAAFDTAVSNSNVVYISEEISSADLGTKLRDVSIGVVSEEGYLADEFGISSSREVYSTTDIDITDVSHYITDPFTTGALTITSSAQELHRLTGSVAPGLNALAESTGKPTLSAINQGAQLYDSGTAAGRRVQLPWGNNPFDINSLNTAGKTIMLRSLKWAAAIDYNDIPFCEDLVGYWEMDETSGTNAADKSGSVNDGVLTNMDPVSDWVSGKIVGALDFDGINDYVQVPYNANLSIIDELTVAAWIYARAGSLSGYDLVLNKGTSGLNQNYWFGTSGSEITFGWYDTDYREFVTSGLNLQTETWYHIAATFTDVGNEVKLYLNGTNVKKTNTMKKPIANTDDLYIGTSQHNEPWNGLLDEVRIYNRVLTESEIMQLHAMNSNMCSVSRLLFVVPDSSLLGAQDTVKKTLFESWGYDVTTISAADSQAVFDAAAATSDAAYISEEISSADLGTKLRDVSIGVVSEEGYLADEFGISSSREVYSTTDIDITDVNHYITDPFTTGALKITSSAQELHRLTGSVAPGLNALAESTGKPTLSAINQGAQLYDSGTAAGRRVQLPWGNNPFDINSLNTDGKTIMRRAIEWARGQGNDGPGGVILNIQVTNDAEERVDNGSVNMTSTDMELVFDGSVDQLVGLRFVGVTVPPGSTITNAYIQFKVDEIDSGATNLDIAIEDIDNSPEITATNYDISGRTTAPVSVPWVPPAWNTVGEQGPDQQTPDISSLIQAVVDRADWVSGNAIAIIITGTGERTAESQNGDAAGAPILHIEY